MRFSAPAHGPPASDNVGLTLVATAPPAVAFDALLAEIERVHATEDQDTVQAAAVTGVERLIRGSAAALFSTTADSQFATLCAAGPGWRSAERDAPAWLAPLSGPLARLVRSDAMVSGRFVSDREGHGPDLAVAPLSGSDGARFTLLVAWPPGLAASRTDLVLLDRLVPHLTLALHRARAAGVWREMVTDVRLAQEALAVDHAERAASSIAGGAAHDLNNALSMLVGLSEGLLDLETFEPAARRDIAELHTAVRQVARLAGLLTFVARIPQGGTATEVDLPTLLSDVRVRLRGEGLPVPAIEVRRTARLDLAPAVTQSTDLAETVAVLLRLHTGCGAGTAAAVLEATDDGWRLTTSAPAPPDAGEDGTVCRPHYDRRARWSGPLLCACRRLARAHGWTFTAGAGVNGDLRVTLIVPIADWTAAASALS